MSLDMNGFLNNVKRAAVEAVKADAPFALVFGAITSVSPLKVQIDQKLELFQEQLILTSAVRDYTVTMTVDHATGSALGQHAHDYSGTTENGGRESHTHGYGGCTASVNLAHSHSYSGTKTYRVHNALKVGERVVLLRCDGGQKFIILDRVEVTG